MVWGVYFCALFSRVLFLAVGKQLSLTSYKALLDRCSGQITHAVSKKVTFSSGTMSSYAVMNENWMLLSWVMLQSESEQSLESIYCGTANCYSIAGIPKARYQWVESYELSHLITHHIN